MSDYYSGFFVAIEGIDVAGKTTQINLLHDHIKNNDKYADVLTTHEPWESKKIKKKLAEDKDTHSGGEELTSLFVEDRMNHLKRLIIPNLMERTIVLCDRYMMSTFAYQGTQGVDTKKIEEMHYNARVLKPNLTIFLDIDYDCVKERLEKRGQLVDKFESDEKFTRNLIENYRVLHEKKDIFGNVVKVDGNRTIEKISSDICRIFDEFYKKKSL